MFDGREGRSKLGEYAIAGRELDKGLAALEESLMVASQPTPPGDPGKAAFHHPSSERWAKAGRKQLVPVDLLSFGHHDAPLGNGESANGLHGPAKMLFEPADEAAARVAITPNQLDSGKGLFQWLNHYTRSLLIGVLGTEHFDGQEMADTVSTSTCRLHPQIFSPRRSLFQGRQPHWS